MGSRTKFHGIGQCHGPQPPDPTSCEDCRCRQLEYHGIRVLENVGTIGTRVGMYSSWEWLTIIFLDCRPMASLLDCRPMASLVVRVTQRAVPSCHWHSCAATILHSMRATHCRCRKLLTDPTRKVEEYTPVLEYEYAGTGSYLLELA